MYFILFSMIGFVFASENTKEKKIESPFDIRFPDDNIFKDVEDCLESMAKNVFSQDCSQMEKTPDKTNKK